MRALRQSRPIFAQRGATMPRPCLLYTSFGGLVNASYSMDTVVHNTIWIVGHFHVTVGGPVALTFLGAAYWMIPRLTGRALWKPEWALFQTRLWFFGMLIMSLSMHYAGLLGAPRRTADVGYLGANVANSWEPLMLLAAAGGFFIFISIPTFVAVAIGTLLQNAKTESMEATFAAPAESAATTPPMLQHVFRWGVLALLLAVLAYAGPLGELLRHPGYLAPGMRTW